MRGPRGQSSRAQATPGAGSRLFFPCNCPTLSLHPGAAQCFGEPSPSFSSWRLPSGLCAQPTLSDRRSQRPIGARCGFIRAGRRGERPDGGRGFRRRGPRQADRGPGRRSSEQGRCRPRRCAAMVRRAGGEGDLRHHQFGRRAGGPGPGQNPRSDRHLRFRLLIHLTGQGLLAERCPVERRQLVERGRADAASYQAEARQLLLHYRRLRLPRFARSGRTRRDRKAGGTVIGGLRAPLNTADFSSFSSPPRRRKPR